MLQSNCDTLRFTLCCAYQVCVMDVSHFFFNCMVKRRLSTCVCSALSIGGHFRSMFTRVCEMRRRLLQHRHRKCQPGPAVSACHAISLDDVHFSRKSFWFIFAISKLRCFFWAVLVCVGVIVTFFYYLHIFSIFDRIITNG